LFEYYLYVNFFLWWDDDALCRARPIKKGRRRAEPL